MFTTSMTKWHPITTENKILKEYWLNKGGRIYTEVRIGGERGSEKWPKGSKYRYIDGVYTQDTSLSEEIVKFRRKREEFLSVIKNSRVKVIEVKQKLNRPVIGQIIAGLDMFKEQYQPAEVKGLILCHIDDPVLQWVCKNRGIEVVVL